MGDGHFNIQSYQSRLGTSKRLAFLCILQPNIEVGLILAT